MLEYYSKLNQEVEKSKIHTEWKIKRLQLDESRMQLLSSEERNLKREKLELEHKRNEEIMAMSLQSIDMKKETEAENYDDAKESNSTEDTAVIEPEPQSSDTQSTKSIGKTSTDVIFAICNAARSIFGGSKSEDSVDNKKDLDAQGNVVPVDTENNTSGINKYTASSDEIGSKLDDAHDNRQFLNRKDEALKNKQKVMAHEFGVDKDNNKLEPVFETLMDEENNLRNMLLPFLEAKRNKMKVLAAGFDKDPTNMSKSVPEPYTDAQKEALINKQKVLGVEYNIPLEFANKKDPANVAQEEALVNRGKMLGTDIGSSVTVDPTLRKDPANIAQEEAIVNRDKILGTDIGSTVTLDPTLRKDPAHFAQEQAMKNRDKMLGSDDVKTLDVSPRREQPKRSALTLNLKPFADTTAGLVTPNVLTPGDFMHTLDLETPTTADVQLSGAVTTEAFTPHCDNKPSSPEAKLDKHFLNADGFDFSLLVDENIDAEIMGGAKLESPDKKVNETKSDFTCLDYLDGSNCWADFDPFGVRDVKNFSSDNFTSRMDIGSSLSYTHPAVIMEEVKKTPYTNIFVTNLGPDENDDQKIDCNNIATLWACLQRSVMLPLTYQMEVVNNSILTYFLVNLDMYEHLTSLKDYFFLMDGEFSRSICQNLFRRLAKTLNPQDLLNFATLHGILDKALGSSISHVHKFSENLSFTISEAPLSFQHSSPDVLQCVSLSYAVRWPLNIILSQEALVRYARVFQFLLKMRRIAWVLGEDFESLKLSAKLSREHSTRLIKSPHYVSVQIYRHIMASMMRALDNYIVTTCILTSWKEFETDMKKARTLDDLYECHVIYIKKVLFRCLLNNRSTPVMKLLNDIFTVILKFSRVLQHGEWQQREENGPFVHSNFAQLKELYHLFEKLAKYLHKVITKLMECGYQRHLAELLIMINLNGYYNLEEQNTSVQSP